MPLRHSKQQRGIAVVTRTMPLTVIRIKTSAGKRPKVSFQRKATFYLLPSASLFKTLTKLFN